MAFEDENPDLAKQIEAANIPRHRVIAAIRELASAFEDGTHMGVQERVESALTGE